jgi:hypothetical protein
LRETERGLYTRSEQLQAGEVLRVDHSNRHFIVINDDEIVDPVGLEQFENLDCELVFMDSDRVQGHQVRHQTFAHFRVGLKMPREIAVCENPE